MTSARISSTGCALRRGNRRLRCERQRAGAALTGSNIGASSAVGGNRADPGTWLGGHAPGTFGGRVSAGDGRLPGCWGFDPGDFGMGGESGGAT